MEDEGMAGHVKMQIVRPQKVIPKKWAIHACMQSSMRQRSFECREGAVVGVARGTILHPTGRAQMGTKNGRGLDDQELHTCVH